MNNIEQTEHNTALQDPPSTKKSKQHSSFIAGIIVLIFAVIGVINVFSHGINYIASVQDKKINAAISEYNTYLIPVVAVDPTPFDDIANAVPGELVEIAIWSIISSDLDPDEYDYSSGELAIPVEKVEEKFRAYFGSQTEIEHQTVEGYGYQFSYDKADGVYYIPLTSIIPIYTPGVTGSETKGGATIVTVGLINSSVWMQDNVTGELVQAQAEKYIKITLRESGGETYISAIQSTATPETAQVE